MAKGVKKIKYSKGLIYPKMSVPDQRLTIEPDQWVWFEIDQWENGTTTEDKAKPIKWMRQSKDRKVIVNQMLITSNKKYGLRLTKSLCGSYQYYIEASLSGKRDFANNPGLYVKGWCEPKIISSKWSVREGGDDVRSTFTFSYGSMIYLFLNTEGLNGDIVYLEIYRRVSSARKLEDDQLIYVYKGVEVIDGKINLKIGNSFLWSGKIGNPKDKEEFYIKIKTAYGKYVSDGKDYVHARFLRIKNEIATTVIEKSTNNTTATVGRVDKNKKSYHLCKFNQINITDNDDEIEVFKDGVTLFKKNSPETQSAKHKVYFEFDKADILPIAKKTLDYLLNFLLYNQHLEMLLSGHADDRGTLDYNQTLSERRAQAVKTLFVNGGLDTKRIKTRGFGEVNPIAAGKTEDVYQKNRRVEINFSYIEYNQDAIIYETVAPNIALTENITVNIINRSDKACFRDVKHKKTEVIVFDNQKTKTIKNGDKVPSKMFASHANFPENTGSVLFSYLNPFSTIYNSFTFNINSCAYYADKSKATLEVRTYPDIIWIGHFQYNYKDSGDYFFHNKTFELTTGIKDILDKLTNTILYQVLKITPIINLADRILLPYIKEQADFFAYAIHTIHNRTLEKVGQELSLIGTETDLIKQTKYTKYFAAAVVYEFVVVGIVIDLLLIYLTRGKNLEGRLLKLANKAKKAKKYIDAMKEAGLEIITPAIAINAGMYYQKQKDHRLALVYKANLKANPLIAINIKEEFDLVELISSGISDIQNVKKTKDPETKKKLENNKKNNKRIIEYFKNQEIQIKGTIDITGSIKFEKKIQYNYLTNTYSFTDKLGNLVITAEDETITKDQINFNAKITGEYKGKFDFFRLQNTIETKLEFALKGAAGVKLKYGVDTKGGKGLFVTQSLYCSGVEGTYLGSLKISKPITDLLDWSTNDGKPTPFTLIEPFEVPLSEIQLFKS
ncbi:OmpA family protein [Flavobacterium sp. ALJ2]|uniref:OmpA family protein n=1 Tax=Flavobacterium sp. ALJ2 TaxID=2786960 RepID=UPI00189D0C33|nr:OmpA family protein [Flavobacterium sp. ALJ2]MBF7090761.1 OmpA family protein [Flavobacterium sp. ALJ2]